MLLDLTSGNNLYTNAIRQLLLEELAIPSKAAVIIVSSYQPVIYCRLAGHARI